MLRSLTFALVASALALLPARAWASQDSVPISWALDVAKGTTSGVVVTFPWLRGFSSELGETAPKMVRFFPQVSLLGKSTPNDATTRVSPLFAAGGGICLASAIAIGLGVKLNEPFSHAYFMAGISITDALKLAF